MNFEWIMKYFHPFTGKSDPLSNSNVNWAENNEQNINTNKTKEIIFWKTGKSSIKLSIYRLFLKLNGFNRLGCWVSYFRPIYRSHQRFYLLNQLKKCPSHLPDLATYLEHLLFHAFYMLSLLFMGSFWKVTLIVSTPCSGRPSDGA